MIRERARGRGRGSGRGKDKQWLEDKKQEGEEVKVKERTGVSHEHSQG